MLAKQEALEKIISLMHEHAIKISDIKDRLELASDEAKNSGFIKKLFAYVGGIFILCGLIIYTSMHWAQMNSAARIIISLGSGVAAFIMAIVASYDKKYEKTVTPLLLIGALFEACGLFVVIGEFFHSGANPRYAALIVFGTLLVQQIMTFFKMQRTTLLFTSIAFGLLFFMTLLDLFHVHAEYIALISGFSLTCIAYGLHNSQHDAITPFWYFIGGIFFLSGLFEFMRNTPFEILYLFFSAAVIYLSTIVRSRSLLFCGTVSMIAFIFYFSAKYFISSMSWPLILIFCGIVLLGISAMAVRIAKKIK